MGVGEGIPKGGYPRVGAARVHRRIPDGGAEDHAGDVELVGRIRIQQGIIAIPLLVYHTMTMVVLSIASGGFRRSLTSHPQTSEDPPQRRLYGLFRRRTLQSSTLLLR